MQCVSRVCVMVRSRVMLGYKFRVRGRVRGSFRERVDGVIPLSQKGFVLG